MAKAIRFYEPGPPDVLRWEAVDVGEPGPGEVRQRHGAVGLNFADTYFRTGLYPAVLPAGMGVEAAGVTTSHVFWSGVIGGWIIALVAWLVSGSHSITGSVMLIWLLTFVVGLGGFAHCIATSGEILSAILDHQLAMSRYFAWIAPATLGNICGGVLLVTLLEYGQVKGGEEGGYYR